MPRFRPLIVLWIVVVVQITPGPLGLRPVYAYGSVPPASGDEWVTVASGGGVYTMIRQGHDENGVISPPSSDPNGKVTMPIDVGRVYQNQATGKKAFVQSADGIMEVDLATGEAREFLKNNASAYPGLNQAANSRDNAGKVPEGQPTHPDGTPWRQGDIVDLSGLPIYSAVAGTDPPTGYQVAPGLYSLNTTAPLYYADSSAGTHGPGWFIWAGRLAFGKPSTTNPGYTSYYYWSITAIPATTPVEGSKPPTDTNPTDIGTGLTKQGFPGNGKLNGEIVGLGAALGKSGVTGVTAEDVAKMEGFGGDIGDGVPEPSDVPQDPSEEDDDNEDGVYSPSPVGDPYPQDEDAVNFGGRMSEFFASAKQSAIFSLPSHFADIPTSSTTVSTIDGGQLFGTINFDFSSMAPLWVIIKSIVLTGFSFVSTRIVCLKR
ncbi:MAG: hypothetical protein ACD_74C00099G0012 [uncultured bacterium]|nr:MAG: hypothetical protein ACD_74C00099G0012 [uncultured bacterium]